MPPMQERDKECKHALTSNIDLFIQNGYHLRDITASFQVQGCCR